MTHDGPCTTNREFCFRPECRRKYGEHYKTVEILLNGHVVYHCHKIIVTDPDKRREEDAA